MRGFLVDEQAQNRMIDTLFNFECEVSQNMLNPLLEIIQEQQLQEKEQWPLIGFNEFDSTLKSLLIETETLECLRKDAIRYFKDKHTDTQELVNSLIFDGENIHSNETLTVIKRGIKQHSSCTGWSNYGGRYNDIQSASSFSKDTSTYNRRKHCLAHFRLGGSKAAADIYAGYFAGYKTPASSDRKKLFAKAVAKGKIFKKKFSIGTVLLYFQTNGNGKTPTGRVYARIAGKPLIDKNLSKASYKSTKKLYSIKDKHIPIVKIPLYIITINIDLVLSASIEVTTHLRLCNTLDLCLTYTPKATTRPAASASVSLGVVRGGADLGVNLNYYVEGEGRVRLKTHPCIILSHGADKNSISLQFWYQIRSNLKVKAKLWPPKFKIQWKWGSKKTWKPSSLSWSIKKAKKKQIYSNCKVPLRRRLPIFKSRIPKTDWPKIRIPKISNPILKKLGNKRFQIP